MKAVQQEYKTGILTLEDIDKPSIKSNEILVKNEASIVSVGTEKTMIELAKKSLIGKAIVRPDLVRRVLDSVKNEGITETYRQVKARLENPILLGYSSSGTVLEIGELVTKFKPGDRVACTGSGHASHSEYVAVPEHLCATLPTNVSFQEAAFCALGGIALESIKMANIQDGDTVGVIGIGLIGLITIQVLSARNCKVIALDIDPNKLKLAQTLVPNMITSACYHDFQNCINANTDGKGVDSVIITASTDSNEPIEASATAVKLRGTVVSTGLTGLNIPRQLFYEKELRFAVSKAWGDDSNNQSEAVQNRKHPSAFQNITEFLELISNKNCDVVSLITSTYNINNAIDAYKAILNPNHSQIGIVLDYSKDTSSEINHTQPPNTSINTDHNKTSKNLSVSTGIIGAGLYASGTFLPAIKKHGLFKLISICAPNGVRAKFIQKKYHFQNSSTDAYKIINDPLIDLAIILTRHDSHAHLVGECLKSNKHIFVEKPLALNVDELKSITNLMQSTKKLSQATLMVGFNRRFSRFSIWAKQQLPDNVQMTINMVVNAGNLNPDHWADEKGQGGRIIGEVCHFIDLAQYFTNSRVYSVSAYQNGSSTGDNVINLEMESGSIVNITYVTSGNRRHRRESVEIYCGGKIISIHNFKKAYSVSTSSTKTISNWLSTDRGHVNQLNHLYNLITNPNADSENNPDYINTTLTSFAIEQAILTGENQTLSSYQKLIQ
ncbi:MAG: zinc-binding dehydrogenase [SAR202 cluster bacterium]|nr:zinc-binding dehydrogenase [SAR202 cluster bacterium]